MNRTTIIGNLTKDPELRSTQDGTPVCTFDVAVNRKKNGKQEADYFKVTAWRELGTNCGKFLQKGKKVAVVGLVGAEAYIGKQDGKAHAVLTITANEVEFLSPRIVDEPVQTQKPGDFTAVDVDGELPF